jgi:hypothetical protein
MTDDDTAAPTDISAMTPEQATAFLKAKADAFRPPPSATPATASEAAARLHVLAKDSAFYSRLMNGNAEARRELANLNRMISEGDRPADVLAGRGEPSPFELTSGNELNTHKTIVAVEALRAVGLGENTIHDLLTDESHFTAEDVAIAARAKVEMLGSKEWRERYSQGDPEACRMMAVANSILVSGIAAKK